MSGKKKNHNKVARVLSTPPKLTPNKIAYQEQLDKLLPKIQDLEKQGAYLHTENYIKDINSRITKEDVDYITRQAFTDIFSSAEYVDEYGETIPWVKHVNLASFEENAIENFKLSYRGSDSSLATTLDLWVDKMVDNYGTEFTANMLARGHEQGLVVSKKVLYHEEATLQFITDMMDIMIQGGYMEREVASIIMDNLDRMEGY